jgi:hypothetical protein
MTPSEDNRGNGYAMDEWSQDLNFWFSKGEFTAASLPGIAAHFERRQAGNPRRSENRRRLGMALAFLQGFMPELVKGGALATASPGDGALPPALVTALYRAFMSPVALTNPRGITVPLILEVVKDQRDWNEDRT